MPEPEVSSSTSFARQSREDFALRTTLTFFIFGKEDQRFVGSCSLQNIDWTIRAFELGYWLRTSRHGQGLATEAISAIVAMAFDQLKARRVHCRTDELNVPSRRLCERLGLRWETTLVNERLGVQGEPRNTCVHARCG